MGIFGKKPTALQIIAKEEHKRQKQELAAFKREQKRKAELERARTKTERLNALTKYNKAKKAHAKSQAKHSSILGIKKKAQNKTLSRKSRIGLL